MPYQVNISIFCKCCSLALESLCHSLVFKQSWSRFHPKSSCLARTREQRWKDPNCIIITGLPRSGFLRTVTTVYLKKGRKVILVQDWKKWKAWKTTSNSRIQFNVKVSLKLVETECSVAVWVMMVICSKGWKCLNEEAQTMRNASGSMETLKRWVVRPHASPQARLLYQPLHCSPFWERK